MSGFKNELTKRKQFDILRAQLENERSSFLSHWRDLGEHILPRRPRFTTSENNKGDRKNQKIIDATATMAARTLRSGMMSGVTSPARPWFRLSIPDPQYMESGPVKDWLHIVTERMSATFIKSNLYNVLPTVYGDMGVFGTAAMMVEEDFDDVMRFYVFPIGSYAIAVNDKLKVDIFYREFRMTVRQVVDRFGVRDRSGKVIWDNISNSVRSQYESGHGEAWVDVCHMIRPNQDFDDSKVESKHKKFSSCYYEKGSSKSAGDEDKILREMGYDYFPVLCPRWEVTGEDVYGTECPGMIALGDIRALQLMQKKKAQAIEKMVNPPMVAPTSMANTKISLLPGDVSFSDARCAVWIIGVGCDRDDCPLLIFVCAYMIEESDGAGRVPGASNEPIDYAASEYLSRLLSNGERHGADLVKQDERKLRVKARQRAPNGLGISVFCV